MLDADKIGHAVLDELGTILKVKQEWGDRVIRDNRVSRKDLAAIVFDPETGADQLEKLEAMTHPRIRQCLIDRLAVLKSEESRAVVIDAPLLFEAGWDELCDKVVFVECELEIREARALGRGWSREEFRNREASQMSIDEKRRRATDLIDNSGDLEQTRLRVNRVWLQWGLGANS